jgi:hypothetical protein
MPNRTAASALPTSPPNPTLKPASSANEAHHDERPDQAGHQSQQCGRDQRLLHEPPAQQVGGDVKGEQVIQ